MAAGLQEQRETFAGLATAIVEDVQRLFKLELRLARHEVREDFERAKVAGAYFGVACGAMLVGLFVLANSFAQLLAWAGLPLWVGSLIVATVLLLIGGACLWIAIGKAENLGPDQTIDSVKENLKWVKRHV